MRVRLSLGLAVWVLSAAASDVRVVEEIVAKVNGDIITRSEIERTRQGIEAELRSQGLRAAQLEEALKQREGDALRDRIDQMLLVQKAKDLNISVDADVNRRLAEIQLQSKITDPDKFHAMVREQTGLSFEDFKAQLRDQLLTQRVVGQEIGSRISVSEEEKKEYYEEHKNEFMREEMVFLRQILVSSEKRTPEDTEKRAKELLARARRGEKFGELARDTSDDVETARNYGELPPFKRAELRKEIEDVVFKADRGFVTDLIKVPNGYLILRVEDRWAPGQASYEEVQNEVTERLVMPRMQPRVREYLTKLRMDAFLEIREGYADSGAAPGKDTAWKDPAQLKPETITKEEVAARKKKKLLWIFPRPWGGGGESQDTAGSTQTGPAPAAPPAPAPAAPPAPAPKP